MPSPDCPLCEQAASSLWHTETRKPLQGREFWRCHLCGLVFVPAEFHLDGAAEKQVYELHENNPDDPGYRRFLNQLLQPLLPFLEALKNQRGRPLQGLDFGCGPGPTLSLMLQEAGFLCTDYDPYFAPVPHWQQPYDFIVSTEVFEHLSRPGLVLEQLSSCLQEDGLLVIMTQRPRDLEAFRRWHYLLDPTHITFFSDASLDWISQNWPLREVYRGKAVVILKRLACEGKMVSV
ncbi:class I SAM-dependent methyltransferase [Marinospirillum perlucidum]|uniref:class I SAM-dependent methyltransferase n=1 Tax=Marinospirillum perlucidum TaxID=1982602 RepID=UPI000DF2DFE4|nr:class I SAM-dependent methyltransferase [Marinospirillum perlucidum]